MSGAFLPLLQPVAACTRAQVLVVPSGLDRSMVKGRNDMNTTNEANTTQAAPADTPQVPVSTLTPEAVVEALRALRAQIGDATPLTTAQRKSLRGKIRANNPILQASINAIGALDKVAAAVGQPANDVRELYDEANRWTAVEDEMRAMLNGITSSNLIRRQQVSIIAAQASMISTQLVRTPDNAALVPHVQEIKRLKSFARRKKTALAPGTPQSPASGTAHTPASGTPQSSSQAAAPATPVSQVPGTSGSHQA
jgi:hypothetical protein